MYHSIKNVIPDENYVLSIMFANNEIATLDMKPYLDFGVFKRIKEYQQFKKVCISFDTIAWPSVGIDLDPEFIYQKCNRFNSVF